MTTIDPAPSGWTPDRWMQVADDGTTTLLGGWCPSSQRYHFPPATTCPYTGADDVEVVALARHGSLWAWTAVTAAPPGYSGPVPYGFGIVELMPGGLRVLGRITESDPAALRFGQPMEVVTETLPGGHQVWAFAPSPEVEP